MTHKDLLNALGVCDTSAHYVNDILKRAGINLPAMSVPWIACEGHNSILCRCCAPVIDAEYEDVVGCVFVELTEKSGARAGTARIILEDSPSVTLSGGIRYAKSGARVWEWCDG